MRTSIRMPVRRWFVAACLVAAAPLISTGTAHAHGGIIRAFEILNNPARPELFVLRSDVWGFFHSHDGGQSWQWSCAEVYASKSTSVNRAPMSLTDGGRLVVGSGFQGVHYTDDFCSWSRSAGLDDLLVTDVQTRGAETFAISSTGVDGDTIENVIWRSTDDGASFEPFNTDLPHDIFLTAMAFAPSDANRLYVTGLVAGVDEGVVLRSSDGGRTFERFRAPASQAGAQFLRIHAVHPHDSGIVFAWVDLPEQASEDAPDEIHVSSDGGETWSRLFMGNGDLPGLAISPDGSTLAISGSVDGVFTAPMQAALRPGQYPLTQVNPRPVWGLLWNASGLYGGNNNFSVAGTPEPYTLGLSQDGGRSFSEIVNICEFQFSRCQVGSDVVDACTFDWEDRSVQGGFIQDFWLNSGRCEETATDGAGGAASSVGGTTGGSGASPVSGGSAGESPTSGGASAGTGGASDQDELRVTSCAISRASRPLGVVSLTLAAASASVLLRRRTTRRPGNR